MYELSVQAVFSAAHAIVIRGEREPVHGHTWHVTATVAGESLDADGLLCDFHGLERQLCSVAAALDNCNLNATPPFDRVNPTAEQVARHIARAFGSGLPGGVKLRTVSVTEAPGCTATYREHA
jgi:6-pyruvoyltetrahydropterin/6-carboxytetrahydropterin synthase